MVFVIMKTKKKICFVVTNRASFARVKTVIHSLLKSKNSNIFLLLTASSILEKFGDIRTMVKKIGVKQIDQSYTVIEGGNNLTMAKTTGLSIIEISNYFSKISPDLVITIGDRFETLATAISASYMNIRLAHIQGGEITGSIDESVRHAITKLAHVHFPSTENAKKNIIKMGEDKNYVFLTGCPSIDIVKKNNIKLNQIDTLKKGGVGIKFDFHKPYLLVIFHPVTTEFGGIEKQTKILANTIDDLNLNTIWLWPNVDAGTDKISKILRIFREKNKLKKVTFFKNFDNDEYITILKNCSCAIGNSSSFIREGSFIGLPAVNIGSRQNKREKSRNITDVKIISKKNIKKAVLKKLNSKFKKEILYGSGNAGKKIAKILEKVKPPIQKVLKY
jgi:UDP-hydrolysing UDP-N-acetyl-D-glucosamine 2-epimerase